MKDKGSESQQKRYRVPAVEQAARIVRLLADEAPGTVGLTRIAAEVGVHKSKAYSILQTLQEAGLIQAGARRKGYTLGPGLIALARRVQDAFSAPYLAEPVLTELAKKAGGTAAFGLIAGNKAFVVTKKEFGGAINVTLNIGQTFPLTMGSSGKAMVAFFKEKEREKILSAKDLYFYGSPEKCDRTKLMQELDLCRREGYAMDPGECVPFLNTVAAPVFGSDGNPVGHIVVLGLFSVESAKLLGPQVADAARGLSIKMGGRIA